MSHYVKRILEVGESMKGIIRDKDRNHCGRLTTIDEFSKLLLAVDDLYIEAKKDKVFLIYIISDPSCRNSKISL